MTNKPKSNDEKGQKKPSRNKKGPPKQEGVSVGEGKTEQATPYKDQNLVPDRRDDSPEGWILQACLLYTSPSPRDKRQSRMPSSA